MLLGGAIPPEWQLDFAVPLSFLALLIPAVKGKPTLVAALVGGALVLVTRELPFNLGLIMAALGGIAAGMIADRGNA